ncbi:MAG TPA: cysteine desulfurase-like protein [Acidimicrobiia bacterium]|nr:cysteine desulfurase-like protein [Acidimicrobiia bacterium]
MTPRLDVASVRSRFPALSRAENGHPAAFLDGPGGTQVPTTVIEAMSSTMQEGVSNLGGGFGPSNDAATISDAARSAMARFFNCSPDEVVFGQNMTSLTFAMSRALARTWDSGDSIVLTSLDHDANFTPWEMAADESGVYVRVAELDTETGTLDPDSVTDLIDGSTRLVAVCLASNALGTTVDVATIVETARSVGALVYVDAVHAGPHRLIDVGALGCDFLVASAYKFFGPHTGIVYGKTEHLSALRAYKVRPAPSHPPDKWETGTQSFESMAGVAAAVDHIASLGEGEGRTVIESAFSAIGDHERTLGARFLDGIADMSHVRLYGIPEMDEGRVATFAVAVEGIQPDRVAARMAERGIYVWSGHYYALQVMDRLGVLEDGGLVRIGFCHYNTTDEVDRALEVLADVG